MEVLQSCAIIGVVEKKFFNQAFFMDRVDAAKEECGLDNKQVAEELGYKTPASAGTAYSEWLSGVRGISCEQAVGLCKRVGIRPAWAMFDEGPKSDEEAKVLGNIRAIIASLTTPAGQPVEPPDDLLQQSPRLQLSRKECVEGLRALHPASEADTSGIDQQVAVGEKSQASHQKE